MSPPLLCRLPLLLFAVGVAACGTTTPGQTGPSIAVDAPACETGLETLFATNGGGPTWISSIAVGSDGAVYFADESGIYALSPTDHSVRSVASGMVGVTQLWVNGETLVLQQYSEFYTLPISGGSPRLFASLPGATDIASPFTGIAVMDSTDLYVFSQPVRPNDDPPVSLWRVPRSGGAPQVLSSSSTYDVFLPLTLDETYLYFAGGEFSQIFRLPKTGGVPTAIQAFVTPQIGGMSFAIQQGYAFGEPVDSPLERYSLDGSKPPTRIDGVDGLLSMALSFVNDDRGAYAAFWASPSAITPNGDCTAAEACVERLAIAPLPLGNEHVTAHACSTEWKIGDGSAVYFVQQMTLDASSVYVLASVSFALLPAQRILRAAR